jgi:hypothetical protein
MYKKAEPTATGSPYNLFQSNRGPSTKSFGSTPDPNHIGTVSMDQTQYPKAHPKTPAKKNSASQTHLDNPLHPPSRQSFSEQALLNQQLNEYYNTG